MMNIGKRISELRNKKGISQLQLAKDLNVSTSTVSMWETNKRAIKNERIIQLADYFNVTTDYLLGRVEFDNNDLIAAFNEVVAKFTK
ncbi:helix-turn-helix domain-containing protein [Listeria monocytogenes]